MAVADSPYTGRFAPSPSGPLHAGSLLAAVVSWVDARAHNGRWMLRFEDVDTERCRPEYQDVIRRQLSAFGLEWDAELPAQSTRLERYQSVLNQWQADGRLFACACTRRELAAFRVGGETGYPGTCRDRDLALPGNAIRFRLPEDSLVRFEDRAHGTVVQMVSEQCGDIVLRRRTGDMSYQFAVSVDDADQSITHVVRGDDLLASTGRQRMLLHALNVESPPQYLHHPVLADANGQKLSKSTGAAALDHRHPERALLSSLSALNDPPNGSLMLERSGAVPGCRELLEEATEHWRNRLMSSSGKIKFSCIAASHG